MFCSLRCSNNKNVTRNYCKFTTKKVKLLFAYVIIKQGLLACVDVAMILSNCKVVAQDTPSNLVKNINAKCLFW